MVIELVVTELVEVSKYGFKLHLVCNDKGELLSFCLTPGNVDDRDPQTLKTLTKKLFGKLFGDNASTLRLRSVHRSAQQPRLYFGIPF